MITGIVRVVLRVDLSGVGHDKHVVEVNVGGAHGENGDPAVQLVAACGIPWQDVEAQDRRGEPDAFWWKHGEDQPTSKIVSLC